MSFVSFCEKERPVNKQPLFTSMASQYDIPWHMLKGLDPANPDVCTLKGSVTTGMEPSARDEIAVKLRSVAYCARGRVFFDVKMDQVGEALKLRSLDHVHVLIAVEPNFGFVKNKALCLRRLRLLPRQLDWHKALAVWQRQSGFQGEPHTRRADHQLEAIELTGPAAAGDAAVSGDPLRDMLHSLRQPVRGTCPEQAARGEPEPGGGLQGDGVPEMPLVAAGHGNKTAAAASADTQPTAETIADVTESVTQTVHKTADVTALETADVTVCKTADVTSLNTADVMAHKTSTDVTESATQRTAEASRGEAAAVPCPEEEARTGQSVAATGEAQQTWTPANNTLDKAAGNCGQTLPEKADDEPADGAAMEPGAAREEGAVSFRATCFRAGGGKQGHAFSSSEAAEKFGGAVQELFDWRVRMKGYDLEVILDIAFDMVSVGLSLTPRALFYRNLVKMGPTSLRSTVCFCLLMMAKPQPYEVVVDPLCGGGSISLEGAQAFPGTYHLCGDSFPEAAARVALNREHSARQRSPTVQLAVDVLTWDCTRLPLRGACADVIVSDLPFGKRMGSKFDNRTLYPACMEEMARICTPRFGRAVLLTQDKRTMEKTLHLGRIRSLWRCRASPYVNIGGLDGCAYYLQRTDYVRRSRPPPPPCRQPPTEAALEAERSRAADTPAAQASAARTVGVLTEGSTPTSAGAAASAGLDGAAIGAMSAVAAKGPALAQQAVTSSEAAGPKASETETSPREEQNPDSPGSEVVSPAHRVTEAGSVDVSVQEPASPDVEVPVPSSSVLEEGSSDANFPEKVSRDAKIPEEIAPEAKVVEKAPSDANVQEEVSSDAKCPEEASPDNKVPNEVSPESKVPEEEPPNAKVPGEVSPDAIVPEEASADAKVLKEVHPDAKHLGTSSHDGDSVNSVD